MGKFYLYDTSFEECMKTGKKVEEALYACNALLSDIYIYLELADSVIADFTRYSMKKPFYKFKFKKAANESINRVSSMLEYIKSEANREFLEEAYNSLEEILKEDIDKLKNSLLLEYRRKELKYADDLVYIEMIRIFLRMAFSHFEERITYCEHTYSRPNYRKQYRLLDPTDMYLKWCKYYRMFMDNFIPKGVDINVNDNVDINNGVKEIINKIKDPNIAKKVNDEASQYGDNSECQRAAIEVLNKFGVEVEN